MHFGFAESTKGEIFLYRVSSRKLEQSLNSDKESFLSGSAGPACPPVGKQGLKHNQEKVVPVSNTSESAVRNAERTDTA